MNKEMYAHHYKQALQSLEYLINATPSSQIRNQMTSANILLITMSEDIEILTKLD